jgi:PKD repeat protein
MTTLPHKASSPISLTRKLSVLSLSLLLMVAGTLFAAPSALAQQGTSTSETAGQQEQQTIIHITKDGTNSYLISGGSSSIGSFDTSYRIVGERSAVRASEELIITTITEDFKRSPTIGYVGIGTSTTNTGGTAQDTTTNGATLPNPFATPEQITERITSELRRVIGSAENNTRQGQLVEIKCDFGMTLDDMRCFHVPSIGGTGGTTRPPPTNNTGRGNNTEPLTVQAIIDIDQDATSVVLFEVSIDGGTSPYTCDWNLGDNTTSDTCNVSHIYENPGTYTATVTVTDSVGQTASDTTGPFTITNTTGEGETTAPPPPATNATAGGETTTSETTAPPTTTEEGEESITTPPPPSPSGTTAPDNQDVPLSDPDADRPAPPTTGEGAETTTSQAETLNTLAQ